MLPNYLLVRSADRYIGTSSDFIVLLTRNYHGVKAITPKSIIIPNTIYNVITGYNDAIDFSYNGNTYSVHLPQGSYTNPLFSSAIASAMSSSLQGIYSVIYNDITFTYTVTVSGSTGFQFLFGSGPNAATSCARQMGFPAEDTLISVAQIGPYAIALENPINIYINVYELGMNSADSNDNTYTFLCPATTNAGSIIEFTDEIIYSEVIRFNPPIDIHRLTINLFQGANFTPLNLNGSEWQIMFELEYDRDEIK
jgi:hypothetical protein